MDTLEDILWVFASFGWVICAGIIYGICELVGELRDRRDKARQDRAAQHVCVPDCYTTGHLARHE